MIFNLFKKKPRQTFTKTFPIIGEMQCEAKSEADCKMWSKTIKYLKWDNVKLTMSGGVKSPADIDVLTNEYKLALENAASILDSIFLDNRYATFYAEGKNVWANIDEVRMELNLHDMDGNYHPHIAITYSINDAFVWIAIEQGEMTCFTAQ